MNFLREIQIIHARLRIIPTADSRSRRCISKSAILRYLIARSLVGLIPAILTKPARTALIGRRVDVPSPLPSINRQRSRNSRVEVNALNDRLSLAAAIIQVVCYNRPSPIDWLTILMDLSRGGLTGHRAKYRRCGARLRNNCIIAAAVSAVAVTTLPPPG